VYWVYVIQSEVPRFGKRGQRLPGFFYVGLTTDPVRRLQEHNGFKRGGAKYTSKWRPWVARALWGPFANRSEATKAERALKKKRGEGRLRWTPAESSWCRGLGVNDPWVTGA